MCVCMCVRACVCVLVLRSVLNGACLTSRPLRFPAQDNGNVPHRPTVDDFLSEDAQFV